MASKMLDEDHYSDPNQALPSIEFSTTAYAILECEQRVLLKIKRRGPLDVEFRFRCLSFF